MLNVLLEFPLNYSQIFFYANIYPNMFSEKYTVKIIINKELLFSRDYTTYNAILQDFPVFEKSENVRTCKRMLEKHKNPTYKKAQKKYQHIQVYKKIKEIADHSPVLKTTLSCICNPKIGNSCICCSKIHKTEKENDPFLAA